MTFERVLEPDMQAQRRTTPWTKLHVHEICSSRIELDLDSDFLTLLSQFFTSSPALLLH